MTELFNIRHGNAPSDAVNIMRPGPWGNPFPEQEYGREGCIQLYEHWLFLNPTFVALMRRELRHKDLVCCCWPKACHGNVIVKILNGEDPTPLHEDAPVLKTYLSKQKDSLAELLQRIEWAQDDPAPEDDGGSSRATYESICEDLVPHLKRLTRNTREQWPKPSVEAVAVRKADLVAWREEWLETQRQIACQEEGVDIVTPFDQYLYGGGA